MFDHQVAGDSVTVIKSPYYFDRGRVFLDKIVFKFISNTSAAAAALKAGDIQVLDSISPTELSGIRESSRLRVVEQDTFGFVDILFNIGNKSGTGNLPYSNVGTPWSRNAKLRQAFEEAIDRKTLARVVFGGAVRPGCTPVSRASPWFDASVRCTPYDPAHARKLVAGSGVPNPSLRLVTDTTDSDFTRVAQFVQAQAAAVGIEVVIEAALGAEAATGKFEARLATWSGGSDPDRNLYRFLATSGSSNNSGYSNPRLDLILENGRKSVTEKSRRTLYRVAQEIVLADRPIIYLYYPIRYAGLDTTKVSGVDFFADTQLRVAFAELR
jgi:peptide/nickel transport system substrate-binding protein